MTTTIHTDIIDNGLTELISASLKIAVCQTKPNSLADITNAVGVGKRVTDEVTIAGGDKVLESAGSARQVKIASKLATAQATVTQGASDLWIAVYDAARILALTDTIYNEALTNGQQMVLSEITITFETVI